MHLGFGRESPIHLPFTFLLATPWPHPGPLRLVHGTWTREMVSCILLNKRLANITLLEIPYKTLESRYFYIRKTRLGLSKRSQNIF